MIFLATFIPLIIPVPPPLDFETHGYHSAPPSLSDFCNTEEIEDLGKTLKVKKCSMEASIDDPWPTGGGSLVVSKRTVCKCVTSYRRKK